MSKKMKIDTSLSLDYRTRIYEHYVNARQSSLAPATLDGLGPRLPFFFKIIRDHFSINKDIKILDLGCGHGAFVYACQLAGYSNIVGVDCSIEQVEEANKLGIKGILKGDLMDALRSFPDESQDVVIAFDVIEHFTKQELLPFIDEVFRVLREDGKWIIHVPNGEALFGSRIRYSDMTHEIAFTRISLIQLLKSSRFENVICQEDAPIPHGIKSGVRWIFWKLIRGMLRFYLAVETGSGERECIFSQNVLCVATKGVS